jgi:3'-phosphoadenosine 5'-phosphosulfate sulfotransferase (PAPS reductase)/FAD synthetase
MEPKEVLKLCKYYLVVNKSLLLLCGQYDNTHTQTHTMLEFVKIAVSKGAKLYASVSAGKDSQAMCKAILNNGLNIEKLVHADLGRVEWAETKNHCEAMAAEYNIPLVIVKRNDGRDLLAHWQHRMNQLKGQDKPFWSSSSSRYCTSDLKRAPINVFFTSTGEDFIISCEGLRADESAARAAKSPLSIRSNSSSYYKGMTAEEAINNFKVGKKLILNWYPIFNYSIHDVWATYDMTDMQLRTARVIYNSTSTVPAWWPFHPAYVYGNERLSCVFCVLGSKNDLENGAKHNPELLQTLIGMEKESGFTFKHNWSLQNLINQ